MRIYLEDKNGNSRWMDEKFEILHLSQVSGLVWIYADKVDGGNGEYTLGTEPIDFIGVAKVTTSHWHQPTEDSEPYEYDEPEIERRVVGLRVGPDGIEIVNELWCFAGIGRAGWDMKYIEEIAYPVNGLVYPSVKLIKKHN